eukprot:sb/3469609/
MKNLWDDGGYVFGTPSPLLTDSEFRAYYDDNVEYFKNQTKPSNSETFWAVDNNFLDDLAAIGKYQILYYMDYFTTGIDSDTIFVAAPAGVPSNPPILRPCDIDECIYGITLEPFLTGADLPPGDEMETPLVDEIQNVFLDTWYSSKPVMAFKDYKGTVCEKGNLAVLSGQLETVTEELRLEGEELGSAEFLKSPKKYALRGAEEQLRFLHKQVSLQVLSLLVSSMC